jgi:hypothetical protein
VTSGQRAQFVGGALTQIFIWRLNCHHFRIYTWFHFLSTWHAIFVNSLSTCWETVFDAGWQSSNASRKSWSMLNGARLPCLIRLESLIWPRPLSPQKGPPMALLTSAPLLHRWEVEFVVHWES